MNLTPTRAARLEARRLLRELDRPRVKRDRSAWARDHVHLVDGMWQVDGVPGDFLFREEAIQAAKDAGLYRAEEP